MGDQQVLRDEVRDQRAVIDRQREMIEQLESRLAAVERGEPFAARLDGDRDEHRTPTPVDATTDRRHLLTKVAGAAAGAVVGGAALALTQASPAGAAIVETGNPAVSGTASPDSGTGVVGTSLSGYGVQGFASTGRAVYGETSSSGWGVQGRSGTGPGVTGESFTGVGVVAKVLNNPAGTHLRFTSEVAPLPPPQSTVSRSVSSVVCDSGNDLWFCTASGTPGTWRKVSGPSTAGALHVLPTPVRVYDSRPGQPPTGIGPKTPLAASTARTVDLKGNSSGVPAGATAVLVNLIATGTTSAIGGFMSIYRNGIAFPGTSNLNWSGPGQTIAVTTTTAVDDQALCAVYAGSVTDVVIDVIGYYR